MSVPAGTPGGSWDDLVATALLGTGRRGARLDAAVGDGSAQGPFTGSAGHLAALEAVDPARALLDAAALVSVWRRAGSRAQPTGSAEATGAAGAPAPAPAEGGRPVGPAALARLGVLTARPRGAEHSTLLLEWLRAAAAADRRLPPELLPGLLDDAQRDPALAEALAPALGERGRWLAALRPEWRRVLERVSRSAGDGEGTGVVDGDVDVDTADGVWATGSAPQRSGLLAALRRTDPPRGGDLLAGTWASETGEAREALLPLLVEGLGPADEALLERALADRRQAVRATAALLLQRLPGSAYRERWAGRLRAVVHVERRLLRRRVVVSAPQALDADGVRESGGGQRPRGVGEAAWALRQTVACAPLEEWTSVSALPPDRLLAALDDEWGTDVVQGLCTAAGVQRDVGWARALVATQRGVDAAPELVWLLPAEEAAAAAAAALGRRGLASGTVWGLMSTAPTPWSPALSTAVLRHLASSPGGPGWVPDQVARIAAHAMPPDHAAAAVRAATAEAAAGTPDGPAPAHRQRTPLRLLADALTTRQQMLEEIR